jgi:predicted Holliday junction resolvase-like endonuclease
MDFIKELLPYLVSIITAVIAYKQAKKGFSIEIEKIEIQHKHDLDTLVKQHEIDIESLTQKHEMEKELKEKEYQHEIEMQKLKSETAIKEKNEELMGNAMSSVIGDVFNNVLSGKITAQDLEKLSKQFPNKK